MAEVYKAQDEVLGREDAVKILLPQFASDPTFAARFRQEAQAAANLNSPYIVGIYDWGLDGDTYYLVMEYIRGVDLKTAINQRGAIGQRKVAQIASQICSGLSVAHNNNVIHRDIKPQNIMIQPDGNIKIMDFGVARAGNSTMTQTGSVLGTANYVSPEQAQGKVPTAASDLYSLGVLMYEAVTGKLPFEGPDAISVALKQVQETPIPPSQMNPDVEIDPAFEDIILKAMEKNPEDRFSSAEEMRTAINSWLNGNPMDLGGTTRVLYSADDATTVLPASSDKTSVMSATAVKRAEDSGTSSGKKKMSNGKKAIIIIAVIAAIALIAGVSYAILGTDTETVPDLSGMTETEARQAIAEAGFEIGEVTEDYSDTVEEGLVMDQDPEADSTAKEGTEIDFVISQGPEPPDTAIVPDLTGMTAEEAGEALQELGFESAVGDSVYDSSVSAGLVCQQDPAAGSTAEEGSTVTFYLSLGEESISIPYVVGYSESSATSALESAGFSVSTTYSYSSSVSSGVVISQSSTGSGYAGDTITIEVSQGPEPVEEESAPSSGSSSGSHDSGSSGGSSSSNGSSSGSSSDDSSSSDSDTDTDSSDEDTSEGTE